MSTDENIPTFVLGVGAQKAGTAWLHRYLSSYPQADMGFLKEYHVWDRLTLPALKGFRPRARKLTWKDHLLLTLARRGVVTIDRSLVRKNLRSNPDRYFDYFERLLRQGVSITGDITPSYNSLSPEVLSQIRDGFGRRGIAVKAIFLMRDPVDRCWSSVRMERRSGRKLDGAVEDDDALLLAASEQSEYRIRTDYPRTLRNLRAAFGPDALYLGLYEKMFDRSEVRRLSEFFGLPPRFERITVRVNQSEKRSSLTDDTRQRIAESFRSVYEHCAAEFPETRTMWPNMPADLRRGGEPTA